MPYSLACPKYPNYFLVEEFSQYPYQWCVHSQMTPWRCSLAWYLDGARLSYACILGQGSCKLTWISFQSRWISSVFQYDIEDHLQSASRWLNIGSLCLGMRNWYSRGRDATTCKGASFRSSLTSLISWQLYEPSTFLSLRKLTCFFGTRPSTPKNEIERTSRAWATFELCKEIELYLSETTSTNNVVEVEVVLA